MTSKVEGFSVRRLVVAFDAETEARDVVSTVAALAHRWDTSVAGLFIEDRRLERVAALEVGRQIGLGPPQLLPLDPEQMSLQIEGMARLVEGQLRSAAGASIQVSFRIFHGDPMTGLRAEAGEEDLLILSAGTRAVTRYARLSSTICRSVEQLGRSALILTGRLGEGPIFLLDRPGSGRERAMAAAVRLAELTGGRDIVILTEFDQEQKDSPEPNRTSPTAHAREPSGWGLRGLSNATGNGPAGIVLSSASPLCAAPGIAELVDRFGCAILIVSP